MKEKRFQLFILWQYHTQSLQYAKLVIRNGGIDMEDITSKVQTIKEITSLEITELEGIMAVYGESKFRGKQIFEWFHKKRVWDYDCMSNLSRELREKLKQNYPIPQIKIEKKYISNLDGTRKYLFQLEDSHIIEGVLMKYKHGNSVCISSQVGCQMGCKFCASTVGGLVRNLTAGEMLAQIYLIAQDIQERISNVVIMGSGEPLQELEITMRFISLINSPFGQNIGQRHITISTCGIVPAIYELANKMPQITLAVSLHASSDEKRKQIMPIANKYGIAEIIEACKYVAEKTGRRITFEYALIEGENDTLEDAKHLGELLVGLLCHVNLIPVNEVQESHYKSSHSSSVDKFMNKLSSYGIQTTLRRKLGADIEAACGQLRNRYIKERGE